VLSYVAALVGLVVGSLFARMASVGGRVLLLAGLAAAALIGIVGAGQSDSLAAWKLVWLGVLFLTTLLFVTLSAYAAIKGFSEIQYMFRLLVRGDADTVEEDKDEPTRTS
jgi:hypothetical protein